MINSTEMRQYTLLEIQNTETELASHGTWPDISVCTAAIGLRRMTFFLA